MRRTSTDVLALKLSKCYQYERNCLTRARTRKDGHYRLPACWDIGSQANPESQMPSVWVKLARACRDRKIDPIHYIQWSMSMGRLKLTPPPEPNLLLRPRAFDDYKLWLPSEKHEARNLLLKQKDRAELEFAVSSGPNHDPLDTWDFVLSMREFSPLFCFGVATMLGGKHFLNLARTLEIDALLQYKRHAHAYDEAWGARWVPPGGAERAARLYEQLLEEEP